MGHKHTIKTNRSYFLTLTVINWYRVFKIPELSDIVIESLRFCIHHKGLNIYAYCLMPNHLHMVANCNDPFELKDTIRDFKRHTSRTCFNWLQNNPNRIDKSIYNEMLKRGKQDPKNKTIKFWQTGSHAIEVYSPKFTWIKVNYIHKNPVKAGLVEKAENWEFSSARNYMGLDSAIPEVITLPPLLNW